MRIIHLITRLIVGGAQENTVATVLGLRKKPDIQVELISGPTTGSEGSMESSFEDCPEILSIVPHLVRPVHPWKDFLALRALTRALRHRKPEVLHTHSGKAGFLGRLAARRARVPVIIHHIHGPSFGPFQGALSNFTFRTAERIVGGATTHFVCSAEAMARLYLQAGIGTPQMYSRVFSGFSVEPFSAARNDPTFRAQLGLPAGAFVVGKIARLATLKGHEDLLIAAKTVLSQRPDTRFLLLGDGPLRSQLQARAGQMGIASQVVFAGLVPPTDVPRYVGIMDCLVHLSYREALSRALPQALAASKPVVSYDFDGAAEVCFEGETGFLVRTGDVQTVVSRLLQLADDPALRDQLGHAGQKFVLENFPVQKMIDKLHALYLSEFNRIQHQRPKAHPL